MKAAYLFAFFLTISCSHHHKDKAHHHHDDKAACESCAKKTQAAFDKKCAHAVMEGDEHVEGKEEFTLSHGGRKYYFSTKERMNEFQSNLDQNINKANKNWMDGPHR